MYRENALRVENANFGRVLFYLEKLLSESTQYCSCRQCLQETLAHALNTLPPHYHVNLDESGNHFDHGSSWILIDVAVREALERVSQKTGHLPIAPEISDASSASSETSAA